MRWRECSCIEANYLLLSQVVRIGRLFLFLNECVIFPSIHPAIIFIKKQKQKHCKGVMNSHALCQNLKIKSNG